MLDFSPCHKLYVICVIWITLLIDEPYERCLPAKMSNDLRWWFDSWDPNEFNVDFYTITSQFYGQQACYGQEKACR